MESPLASRLCSMFTLYLLFVSSGCAHLRPPQAGTGKLGPILHQMDPSGAILSARVVDLVTGSELYSSDADLPVMPASNMKLLSMATAVDKWEGLHPFKTYLARDGDDLWIIGTGDPGFGDAGIAKNESGTPLTSLAAWSLSMKSLGMFHVKGSLYYYDGAFESQQLHPSWSPGYVTDWYSAPIGGLNFNDNCIDVTAIPTQPGQPARLDILPPTKRLQIINRTNTASRGQPTIQRDEDREIYTVRGSVSRRITLPSKPVIDPGAFMADALRTALASDGVTINGPTTRASAPLDGHLEPAERKIIAVHTTLLAELLPRIGKNSQNLLAEGLCKLLGQAYNAEHGIDEPGSWKSGSAAIHAFLSAHNISSRGLSVADGSGLSTENRVTARLITDILAAMAKENRAQLFINNLSVGGVDGSLSGRFKSTPSRVFAKTGTIHGVRSLSGYVVTDSGRYLAFSFIYNQIQGSVEPFEKMQDEACRLLMTYPKMDYQPVPLETSSTTEASE